MVGGNYGKLNYSGLDNAECSQFQGLAHMCALTLYLQGVMQMNFFAVLKFWKSLLFLLLFEVFLPDISRFLLETFFDLEKFTGKGSTFWGPYLFPENKSCQFFVIF